MSKLSSIRIRLAVDSNSNSNSIWFPPPPCQKCRRSRTRTRTRTGPPSRCQKRRRFEFELEQKYRQAPPSPPRLHRTQLEHCLASLLLEQFLRVRPTFSKGTQNSAAVALSLCADLKLPSSLAQKHPTQSFGVPHQQRSHLTAAHQRVSQVEMATPFSKFYPCVAHKSVSQVEMATSFSKFYPRWLTKG